MVGIALSFCEIRVVMTAAKPRSLTSRTSTVKKDERS